MKQNTKLLHGYTVLDQYTGAASIPIYQTSTFHNTELYCDEQKYLYTRFSNPTIDALEDGLRCIENAKYALSFSSGMSAISNVLMLLNAGEHVILPKEVYGGTCQFATKILPRYQISASFVDMANLDEVESAITGNTRMIYIETPSNPLLKVCDVGAIVSIAKKYGLIAVADNTFMTTLFQDTLALGVDIVVESATKFINGHSDVVAGVVATNNEDYYKQLVLFRKNFGGILGVQDAWLIMRGMKTMGLRMIKQVYYPGLESHPGHVIHMSQAKSGGAVVSFSLASKEDLMSFTRKVKIPILAVSLGGVESILSHPATMSHACLSVEERLEQGVTDELLRLSCGIEDITDLLEDFKQALE